MNRIAYYKLLIIGLLFLCDVYVHAKLLRPTKDRDQKEILVINSKRRVYYPVKDSGLQYQVSGPARVEFISRYPVLRGRKKKPQF